jgi:hypothetical protein
LHLESLRTVQWRNLEDRKIDFSPRVNVLVGGNGQGKTNFLEAVQYLALGRSHRGSRDEEIVRFGADHFYVSGVGQGDAGGTLSIEAGFTPPRSKRLKVDGRPIARLTDLLGVLACVSFGPEDAELTRGAPQLRRRFIDYALAETNRASLEVLTQYRRVVQQRAAVLRDARGGDAEVERDLAVWDEELVRLGLDLTRRRAEAVAELAVETQRRSRSSVRGCGSRCATRPTPWRAASRRRRRARPSAICWRPVRRNDLPRPFAPAARRRAGARPDARGDRIATTWSWGSKGAICGASVRRGSAAPVAVALKMAQAEFIGTRRGRPADRRSGRRVRGARRGTRHGAVVGGLRTPPDVSRGAAPQRLAAGSGDAIFEVRAGVLSRQ